MVHQRGAGDAANAVPGRRSLLSPYFKADGIDAMTIEQLRAMHQARPFQPFDIQLADGRAVPISNPELLAVIPPGRTAIAVHPDGNFEVIDLLLVIGLKSHNGSTRRGRRRS
jgi:hypothetical protein